MREVRGQLGRPQSIGEIAADMKKPRAPEAHAVWTGELRYYG
jgi:hypothetical protein